MTVRLAPFVSWSVVQTAAWLSAFFYFSTVFLNIPYQIRRDVLENRRTFFAANCEIEQERWKNVKFTEYLENLSSSLYRARAPPAPEV